MLENFTRARIDSLTLGERLKKLRENQEIELEELAQNLRIKQSYIEALENGDYESLPTKVYVRGFISVYARYFNVAEKKLIKIFDQEYQIYENIHRKNEPQGESMNRLAVLPKIVFTSQTLIFLIIFLVISSAVLYLFFGVRSFISAPWLVIKEPTSGIITDKQEIIVTGMTKNDATVYINDQIVQVGLDGVFSEKIGLSAGINNINIKSINKFNKEKVENIVVNAKFVEIAPIVSAEIESKISLKIKTNKDVPIKVVGDDKVFFEGILKVDEEKEFFANEEIVVSSEDGKNTLISFNDADFERLSNKNEAVKNKVFKKETEEVTGEEQLEETKNESHNN